MYGKSDTTIDYLNTEAYNILLNVLDLLEKQEQKEHIRRFSDYVVKTDEIRIVVFTDRAPQYYYIRGLIDGCKFTKETIMTDYAKEKKEKEEKERERLREQYKGTYLCTENQYKEYLRIYRKDAWGVNTKNTEKIRNNGHNQIRDMIPENFIIKIEEEKEYCYSYRLEEMFIATTFKEKVTYEEFTERIKKDFADKETEG